MEIKDLLLRLGTENLIKFIDGDLFKILHVRNKSIIKQKNFTETILKLNSEKKILSNTEHRNIILNSLKENEAMIIGKLFNLTGHDIWKKLIEIDHSRQDGPAVRTRGSKKIESQQKWSKDIQDIKKRINDLDNKINREYYVYKHDRH